MIYYNLGNGVEAYSTNIGDEKDNTITTPAHQAHSTNVCILPRDCENTYGVDALLTDQVGLGIGIRTADCVPILLYDTKKRAIAAIHSGWKGTAANIIKHTIETMQREYGTNPADINAAIGPCIHQEAFEVGDEVYDVFADKGYGLFAKRMNNPHLPDSSIKWHIDLPGICRYQLTALGVKNVYVSPLCTYENHETLYSYRYCQCADREHRIITAIRLSKV